MSTEGADIMIDALSPDPLRRTRSLLAIFSGVIVLMLGGGWAAVTGWAEALEGDVGDAVGRVEMLERQRAADDAVTDEWRGAVLRELQEISGALEWIKREALD